MLRCGGFFRDAGASGRTDEPDIVGAGAESERKIEHEDAVTPRDKIMVTVTVDPAWHSTDLYSVFNKFCSTDGPGGTPFLDGAKPTAAALRALGWDVDSYHARELVDEVDLQLERGLSFPDFTTLHKGLENGTLRAPRLTGFDASRGRLQDHSTSGAETKEPHTPTRRTSDETRRKFERQRTPASRSAQRNRSHRRLHCAPPVGRRSRGGEIRGRISLSPRVRRGRVRGSSPRSLSQTYGGRPNRHHPRVRGHTSSPVHRHNDRRRQNVSGPLAYYQRTARGRAGVNHSPYQHRRDDHVRREDVLNRSIDHVRDVHRDHMYDGSDYDGGDDIDDFERESVDAEDPIMGGLPRFRRGAPIRARFGGFSRWFDGVIARVRRDGTYDINYNDGDVELGVPPYLIQRAVSSGRILDHQNFSDDGSIVSDSDVVSGQDDNLARRVVAQVGEQVTAEKDGDQRSATVLQINELDDGEYTYDLLFTDGEQMLDVPSSFIERATRSRQSLKDHKTRKKKKKKKRGKKNKSKLRKHTNGSGSSSDSSHSPSSSGSSGQGHGASSRRRSDSHSIVAVSQFDRGLRVQCRWNRNWLPGKIVRAHGDGSYDILLRDGDLHRHVDVDDIRVDMEARNKTDDFYSGASSDDGGRQIVAKHQFAVHQRVEVNYEGMGKYFRGRIEQAYANGTYDIKYDDGEREYGVYEEMIQSLDNNHAVGSRRHKWKRGEHVEVNFKTRGRWIPARISQLRYDGTYDVLFEDNDRELGVEEKCIRVPKHRKRTARKAHRHEAMSSSSRSSSSSSSSSSDEDSDGNESRSSHGSRNKSSKKLKKTSKKKKQSRPESRHSSRSHRSRSRRSRSNSRSKSSSSSSSSSSSDSDDSSKTKKKEHKRKEKKSKKSKSSNRSDESGFDSGSDGDSSSLKRGSKVEANYGGRGKWYAGKIERTNSNGTYDVTYDDGDKERGVPKDRIREVSKRTGSGKHSRNNSDFGNSDAEKELERGSAVEANYNGRGKWYKGKIARVNSDGTYDVEYDDGDMEKRVKKSFIKLVGGHSRNSQRGSDDERSDADDDGPLEVETKVEARFRGRSTWIKGTVVRANRNGTYRIKYDNGDEEKFVKREYIRVAKRGRGRGRGGDDSDFGGSDAEDEFERGDKVEARYGGRSKWYKGKISMVHDDGTFDVLYEDGDKERRVKKNLIRKLGGDDRKKKSSFGGRSDDDDSGDFERGDKVEARYGGRSKWYKGKISMVHSDGTYDVLYEDGDKERKVKKSLIRKLGGDDRKKKSSFGGRSDDEDSGDFERGDKVEARYGGRSKWYKGKISMVHSDGTYDVLYEDGDKERKVKKSLIRKLGGDGLKKKSSFGGRSDDEDGADFERGDKVEARYGGKSKWYKGKISLVRSDGTYDVLYEDGDKERNVKKSLIRRVGSTGGARSSFGGRSDDDDGDSKFERGDKVEARYGGKSKWYKGKVSLAHSDGTYDILYEDGDKERKVKANLIRRQ